MKNIFIGSFKQRTESFRVELGANAPMLLSGVYINSKQAKKRQAGALQYGRSMIEMMGVLVIIGALSVGGIAGYSKALHQNKVTKSIEQISVISTHLSTIGANGGNYDGMSNRSAVKLKAILPEMRVNAASTTDFSLENPFGGSVVISASSLLKNADNKNTDNQAYTITYSGLDTPSCVAIASNDWGNVKNSSLIGVAAGLTSSMTKADQNQLYLKCPGHQYNTTFNYTVSCTNGSTINIPMPTSAAAEACSACNNNCSVMLKYY